uniref:RRM domain-containing protein n=1 Tax=Davidia involucrata TaxID=16924 RepID=A0A5B7C6H2_DAVIN
MGETGIVRFPGNLDPRAQEFRPRNPYNHNHLTFVQPQIYYPYPYPPYPSSEVQVVPFSEGGGVGYPRFASSPAYVSPDRPNPPLPPPLPPPSATPSRTLLLSSVPTGVSESMVRRELEVFGDVRAVQMERMRDGIVTVHFYDLRHAQTAAMEIREQHMQQQSRLRKHFDALLTKNSAYEVNNSAPPLPPPARGLIAGRAVWAQFMIPAITGVPDGHNQGTLVIFNLDPEVSAISLKEIFQAFGPVKELRETPMKRHQRFVEFYDVRDAAKALKEMNGKEIHGKHAVIEFSRPGGYSKRFSKSTQNTINNFHSPPPPPPPPPPHKISGRSPANVRPRCSNTQNQSSTKKLSFSRGNPNGSDGNGVVQASMAGIGNGIEESNSRATKKNLKKSRNTTSKQQQPQLMANSGGKPWKGRQAKNFDPRFLINEVAILETNCRDSRTTVMIKNIPNKYSQKLLLNMLDNHCIHCNEQIADGDDQPLSSFDFVYLPIDFINKCNVGYGFVNMTSPQATWRLYKAFHLQNWEVFNSRKICEVTYARLQGVEALKEHFKNSKFPCEAEEYMPVVFSPPRDGRHLTEPIPIVGRANPPLLPSPQEDSEADDDDVDDEMDGRDRPEEEDQRHINIVSRNDDDDDDYYAVGGGRSSVRTPKGGDNGDDEDDLENE